MKENGFETTFLASEDERIDEMAVYAYVRLSAEGAPRA